LLGERKIKMGIDFYPKRSCPESINEFGLQQSLYYIYKRFDYELF